MTATHFIITLLSIAGILAALAVLGLLAFGAAARLLKDE